MPVVTSKEIFEKAYKGKYAIGAFNVDNVDMMRAVLRAAQEANSAVIIAVSPGALKYMGIKFVRPALDALMEQMNITVPVVLHLDHGKDVQLCKDCCDNGFTSVMIDSSKFDFETNIAMTKEVVDYAHTKGVVVESELGLIDGKEDEVEVEDGYGRFTHPNDVIEFANRTNIDSLAIAIGTAHGAYKFKPGQKIALRFDILEEIEERLPGFPLVLHGSSSVPAKWRDMFNEYGGALPGSIGIPEHLLHEASKHAVCKINVGTDLRIAYMGAYRKALHDFPEAFDIKKFIVPGLDAIVELVKDKMINYFCSAGHGND